MPSMTAALTLLLGWSLFAFGAVYPWAFAPVAAVAVVGGAFTVFTRRGRWSWLDVAVAAVVLIALVQQIPLPESLRLLLSPHYTDHLARMQLLPPAAGVWAPLTLYPGAWLMGAGTCVAAASLFLWSRDGLDTPGVRRVIRAVIWMSLAASILALVQPALFPNGQVYGFWAPESEGASPAGPFISRNHFASWVILVWPLTMGYIVAHGRSHWQDRRIARSVLILNDARAFWLILAAAMMLAALLMTQSRSGAIGFGAALVIFGSFVWTRAGTGGRLGLAGGLLLVGLLGSLWATPTGVLTRFDRAYSGLDGGRLDIWTQSLTLFREFPITGIGLGSFEVVMPAYQTNFSTLLNHAHNQYLHLLVEGGLLMAVPLVLVTVLLGGTAWRRLRQDASAHVHLRQGACAGLIGLAVQSIVEVPMLTPAVALLAAVSAAVLVRGAESP